MGPVIYETVHAKVPSVLRDELNLAAHDGYRVCYINYVAGEFFALLQKEVSFRDVLRAKCRSTEQKELIEALILAVDAAADASLTHQARVEAVIKHIKPVVGKKE